MSTNCPCIAHKNPRGLVSISSEKSRIRLRWSYQGKRYSLNFLEYKKQNLAKAKKLAHQIEHDMLENQFDCTLAKYNGKESTKPIVIQTIVQLFEEWVTDYKQMDCNINIDYFHIRNTIRKWGLFTENDILAKLNNEKYGAKTYNSRLSILKSFSTWLVKRKYWTCNPLEDVGIKKVKKSIKEDRKPFTEQEIHLILEAVRTNKFCPNSSRYKHSHYYPFLYFIFKTGVRNAEAVGLRLGSLDFIHKTIIIKEVLARTVNGTHSGARIRKETKNGKVRLLPLTPDLLEILSPLIQNKKDDDLLFQSITGLAIDDRMFQRRVFKPILKHLNIEDRVLYACRHTFGSRCIDAGITPVMTAFLMGNNPETALRNYTHQITIPKELPSI